MREWLFWVCCGLQDLSHTKFSVHEAINEQIQTVCFNWYTWFSNVLSVPQGCRVEDMGYLIPEVATGDWAIEILEVQIPIYAPMCPLLLSHKALSSKAFYFRWQRTLYFQGQQTWNPS